MMQETTLVRARSIAEKEVQEYAAKIRPPMGPGVPFQRWYPRIWDDWARDKDHVLRCDVTEKESDIECPVSDGHLKFRTIDPGFINRPVFGANPKWANVIQLRDFTLGTEAATVYPSGLKDVDQLLETMDRGHTSTNSEGIVVRCQHSNWISHWLLPDGRAVFRSWLESLGMRAELSGPGRIALQLMRTLGGPRYVGMIAHLEILELLNKMAHGLAEFESSEEAEKSERAKTHVRFVPRAQWMELLNKIKGKDASRARRHLENLVSRGVLRVGLNLPCPICEQTNWFPIGEINEHVCCERCMGRFPFPSSNPPRDSWSYRTQGVFSIESYAQGGYAVALAVHFFTTVLHGEATWVTNLDIQRPSAKTFEIDFGMWWRRSQFDSSDPVLILGECKSGKQEFESKDIARARNVAKMFPGASLVFVTLRHSLSAAEKKRLATLARAGRKYLSAERWQNPVLILTAHELMSSHSPPYCWKNAGGKYATFAEGYRDNGSWTELCDATQQLHLDLEPYWQWYEQDRLKRQKRRARKPNITPDERKENPRNNPD